VVIVQVREHDLLDVLERDAGKAQRVQRLQKAVAPAPARHLGVEAGVDDDRALRVAQHPQEEVHLRRRVRFAVALVSRKQRERVVVQVPYRSASTS